jgi:hypothetical protein
MELTLMMGLLLIVFGTAKRARQRRRIAINLGT